MAFDVARIQRELQGVSLVSPYGPELAAAIVSDAFRLARVVPPSQRQWRHWLAAARKASDDAGKLWPEQIGMLAHALATTSLRVETVAALAPDTSAVGVIDRFSHAIAPLTAEMIRSNAFRQEEFVRRWIEAVGGEVAGESRKRSRARLEQLDYRKALDEYARAEESRKLNAAKRAKALAEAQQREAQARGWRE